MKKIRGGQLRKLQIHTEHIIELLKSEVDNMSYTNSPLVDFTEISPNKTSPRNHKIDTITIHCTGFVCDVETLGRVFSKPDRKASSNYGIGSDGRIGMYCEEKDRSWCSSSKANDHRAITIETCSEHEYPYAVSDTVMASLIKLVADICKRNGIEKTKNPFFSLK